MKMKRLLAAMTAGFMCLSFAACSGSETSVQQSGNSADSSATDTTPSADTSAPNQESSGADVTSLSGKVTVYMPSPSGLADKIAAGFQEKTGVQVETFQGTTGEILARLEAEEANPVADVVILASWSDGLSMKADGGLMSYTPANADKKNFVYRKKLFHRSFGRA